LRPQQVLNENILNIFMFISFYINNPRDIMIEVPACFYLAVLVHWLLCALGLVNTAALELLL